MTSRVTSTALNILVFAEVALAALFLPILGLLVMATVGSEDRHAAAIFANEATAYGVVLIALIAALIWSAVRVRHRLLAAGAGAVILVAPFLGVSRELGYRIAEHVLG